VEKRESGSKIRLVISYAGFWWFSILLARGSYSQLRPQQRAHPHPFGEGVEAEFLVGRMRVVGRPLQLSELSR